MGPGSQNEDLEKKAVEEILKETNRAAARAEVGGSLSWTKPRHKGIQKRFLNNTMLSTVIQNTKNNKKILSTTTVYHHPAQPSHCVQNSLENVTKPNHQTAKTDKTSSKVVISSKCRYKAYLADFKHKEEIEANNQRRINLGSRIADSSEHLARSLVI